jgi:hypothetical protein
MHDASAGLPLQEIDCRKIAPLENIDNSSLILVCYIVLNIL